MDSTIHDRSPMPADISGYPNGLPEMPPVDIHFDSDNDQAQPEAEQSYADAGHHNIVIVAEDVADTAHPDDYSDAPVETDDVSDADLHRVLELVDSADDDRELPPAAADDSVTGPAEEAAAEPEYEDGGDIGPPPEPPDGTAEMSEPELPRRVQVFVGALDRMHAEGKIGTPAQNLALLQDRREVESVAVMAAQAAEGGPSFIVDRGPRPSIVSETPTELYVSPPPSDRRQLLNETFDAAAQQPTAERGYGLLAVQVSAIQPMRAGNTQTAETLFELRKEYTGSPADHAAVARACMGTPGVPHTNVNLHQLGLPAAFAADATQRQLTAMGYDGPPIRDVNLEAGLGAPFHPTVDSVESARQVWGQVLERDFNLPVILRTIDEGFLPLDRYLVPTPDGQGVRIDAGHFMENIVGRGIERFNQINAAVKGEFVRSINDLFMGDARAVAMYGPVEDLLERMKNGLP